MHFLKCVFILIVWNVCLESFFYFCQTELKNVCIMIYKFFLCSEEVDGFYRELRIDADKSFLDLHKLILRSVDYADDQITSFYLCDDNWDREREIGLVDMEVGMDEDVLLMEDTILRDYVSEEGQKLQYVFDNVNDRAFFLELKEIITREHLDEGEVSRTKGKAPVQLASFDDVPRNVQSVGVDDEELFYGSEGFNDDELNADGFGDLSFDDSNY